jgi:hypothetical protein
MVQELSKQRPVGFNHIRSGRVIYWTGKVAIGCRAAQAPRVNVVTHDEVVLQSILLKK